MRKGQNKSKDKKIELKPSSHRIIIPLYIPKENGYYKESYEIFELCLFSLIKTSISTIKISVISDGCCQSVNDKLLKLHKENHINELIIESENIGKINAVFKALRTTEERLITITDADILFLNNWEKEVINVFEVFPKAGAVCPIPIFRTHFRLTSNIWSDYLFSKKLKFLPVKNTGALTKFANSIGWSRLDKKWKDSILTLEAANGKIAVVGGSHVCCTYKREVFKKSPQKNSEYKLGSDSMLNYLDKPVLKANAYRLATYDNFAYHMGNEIEEWMIDTYKELKTSQKKYYALDQLATLKMNKLDFRILELLFKRLLYFKKTKRFLLKRKGLTKEQIKNYVS